MAVQNKEEIVKTLKENQALILKNGTYKIGLFGSFKRGEQSENSDIDLLVEFKNGKKNYKNFSNLAYTLEDMLGRKVELVTKESLSPHIGKHILNELEYVFG